MWVDAWFPLDCHDGLGFVGLTNQGLPSGVAVAELFKQRDIANRDLFDGGEGSPDVFDCVGQVVEGFGNASQENSSSIQSR